MPNPLRALIREIARHRRVVMVNEYQLRCVCACRGLQTLSQPQAQRGVRGHTCAWRRRVLYMLLQCAFPPAANTCPCAVRAAATPTTAQYDKVLFVLPEQA